MAEVKAGPKVAANVDPATAKVAVGGYVCHADAIVFHDKLKVTTLAVRNTGDRPAYQRKPRMKLINTATATPVKFI